jgi:lipopolysaccharide biosynthesis regulator YciM
MELQPVLLIAVGILGLLLGFGLAYLRGNMGQRKTGVSPESKSYLKGLNYMIAHQPDKAIAEFTKLARLHPEIVEMYLSLGNLFREQGELERAIRLHQSIILRPNLDQATRCQALVDLGLDYQKAGFVDRAITAYREVISRQPDHLTAYRQLEQLYEEEKDWEQAYMTQRKILRLTKSKDQSILAHLQVQMGRAYHEKGKVKEALKRLKTAIDLDRDCTEAYLYLGDIYFAQGKLKSAISAWEEMIESGLSFSHLAYSKLQEAYLAQNQYDKIRRIYERVLSENPADVRTRLALARYYQRLGELELAQEEIKQASQHQPHNQALRQYLLQLMISVGGGKTLEEYQQIFGQLKLEDIPYHCEKCGYQTADSPWKCPQCREWDTFTDPLAGTS